MPCPSHDLLDIIILTCEEYRLAAVMRFSRSASSWAGRVGRLHNSRAVFCVLCSVLCAANAVRCSATCVPLTEALFDACGHVTRTCRSRDASWMAEWGQSQSYLMLLNWTPPLSTQSIPIEGNRPDVNKKFIDVLTRRATEKRGVKEHVNFSDLDSRRRWVVSCTLRPPLCSELT
jgi:hypothetical protein